MSRLGTSERSHYQPLDWMELSPGIHRATFGPYEATVLRHQDDTSRWVVVVSVSGRPVARKILSWSEDGDPRLQEADGFTRTFARKWGA